MKPRQYKKLCKKAMQLLVAQGMSQDSFSIESESVKHNDRNQWFVCWGLNTGPDYFGECDWYDAWFILSDQVAVATADFDSCTGADDDNPFLTSIRDTISILKYGRELALAA